MCGDVSSLILQCRFYIEVNSAYSAERLCAATADLSRTYPAVFRWLWDLINWRRGLSYSIKQLWMTDSGENRPLTFSSAQCFTETPVVIA